MLGAAAYALCVQLMALVTAPLQGVLEASMRQVGGRRWTEGQGDVRGERRQMHAQLPCFCLGTGA
jgi:hypothetical protein